MFASVQKQSRKVIAASRDPLAKCAAIRRLDHCDPRSCSVSFRRSMASSSPHHPNIGVRRDVVLRFHVRRCRFHGFGEAKIDALQKQFSLCSIPHWITRVPHVWRGRSCTCLGRELSSDAPTVLVKIRQLIQGRFVDILRNIAQPFIAGSVMGIALVSLKLHALDNWASLPRLAVLIPTGAMVYAVSIRMLAPSLTQRFFGLVKSATLAQQAPAAIDSTP